MTKFLVTAGLVIALITTGVTVAYQSRDIYRTEGIVQEKSFNMKKTGIEKF